MKPLTCIFAIICFASCSKDNLLSSNNVVINQTTDTISTQPTLPVIKDSVYKIPIKQTLPVVKGGVYNIPGPR